jgi:hypothetical protein
MYTNLADLTRWLSFNINNGKLDGKQVIPADVVERVHTGYADVVRSEPPFTGAGKYGLGWQIGKFRDENVIYHFGGYPGWSTHISYMPDKKIGVAVLVNESTAGGRISHFLATYAYDRLLGRPDAEQSYAKELDFVAGQYGNMKRSMVDALHSRASRTSQLSRPLSDYKGRYKSELMGTIDITVEQNSLAVQNGYIHVVSTPYTEKDAIRVEMIPGQGEVIRFNVNADGNVSSLIYSGTTFTKLSIN